MNRPIKFRAWDGSRMRAWGKYDDGSFIGPPSESGSMEYPQMQFTGLLDKNGKEIYEGDILSHLLYETGQEVRYDGGAFIIGNKPLEDLLGGVVLGSAIIGNIYEHPNLLNP